MIIRQLNQYIRSVMEPGVLESGHDPVELGNIAETKLAGGNNGNLNNKIVVSLVNIGEEGALKNQTNGKFQQGQYVQQPPVVHVNVFLLFAAHFDSYDVAVNQMFRVLEFFQGRKIFKFKNAPLPGLGADQLDQVADIELTAELHTLSFEQLNDLWGSLGGKQMPFVLYRFRLVPVQMMQVQGRAGIITEIDLNTALSS